MDKETHSDEIDLLIKEQFEIVGQLLKAGEIGPKEDPLLERMQEIEARLEELGADGDLT